MCDVACVAAPVTSGVDQCGSCSDDDDNDDDDNKDNEGDDDDGSHLSNCVSVQRQQLATSLT